MYACSSILWKPLHKFAWMSLAQLTHCSTFAIESYTAGCAMYTIRRRTSIYICVCACSCIGIATIVLCLSLCIRSLRRMHKIYKCWQRQQQQQQPRTIQLWTNHKWIPFVKCLAHKSHFHAQTNIWHGGKHPFEIQLAPKPIAYTLVLLLRAMNIYRQCKMLKNLTHSPPHIRLFAPLLNMI